ncbi:YceD family protein [Paenibacillus humicola]|uniref:YceD family protein n=1 Tax=Paenibacillus humicola TaxID=3110540 RepID=UPI00237C4009|nr:DUF177 domain-containing protein [Paenibacillus humicola]
MELRIQEMASKGTKAEIRTTLDGGWLKDVRKDILRAGPIAVDLTAQGEGGEVNVGGRLSTEVELACSRCLEPLAYKASADFRETFKPASAMNGSEPEETIPVEEDKVDLEPFVEETMMLALPFAPLCEESCKGLCHTCGANLNEGGCGCLTDAVDPRFAALKDLFKS